MSYLSHFQCFDCGRVYAPDEIRYLCPSCSADYRPGIPLKGALNTILDYAAIAKFLKANPLPAGRYGNAVDPAILDIFSPLDKEYFPNVPVGNTPLFADKKLADRYAVKEVYIKFDGLSLSGSLKDRASFLMVAEATRLNMDTIVCASTGNAACSLSAICAAAGKKAVIFAPAKAPVAKLTQILIHGAELHKVNGTYDDAFAAALAYPKPALNRNTGYHPYTIEGKKTAGLEIFSQLKHTVPDWIVVPTGDGVILSGIYKAFEDLYRTGLCEKLPRLLSVQNESSDAITSYWESGKYEDAKHPDTIADSISVKTPSLAHRAVEVIKLSSGKSIRVSDDEIRSAQRELASQSGVFAEPSSSSTLAGMQKAIVNGWIKPDQSVLLLVTGHGLKDINAVQL